MGMIQICTRSLTPVLMNGVEVHYSFSLIRLEELHPGRSSSLSPFWREVDDGAPISLTICPRSLGIWVRKWDFNRYGHAPGLQTWLASWFLEARSRLSLPAGRRSPSASVLFHGFGFLETLMVKDVIFSLKWKDLMTCQEVEVSYEPQNPADTLPAHCLLDNSTIIYGEETGNHAFSFQIVTQISGNSFLPMGPDGKETEIRAEGANEPLCLRHSFGRKQRVTSDTFFDTSTQTFHWGERKTYFN